jgi:carboxyl-terminal processing protease
VRNLAMAMVIMVSVAPCALSAQQLAQQGGKDAIYEELNLFDEAFERIREDSVDAVSDSRLVGAAIAGLLTGLDPHAAYIDPATLKAMKGAVPGNEVGIGAALTLVKGELKVISPRDGSPAAEAGLKPGDLILAIDKEPTYEMTLPEVEQKLQGPPGTTVKLTLQRGGEGALLKLSLKRAAEHSPTVISRVVGGDFGYARVSGFDDDTAAALAAAAQNLRQQTGGKLQGLVVDLRNNPGGKFQDAIAAANEFLDKGDVAVIKGHNADSIKHIAASPNDLVKSLPLVVLVNGGTANEAELMAAALQDNHRALLIGTKTFGESSIATLIPLSNGGAIRLTTAHFETPGGREIDGKGLDPDLVVTPLKLEKMAKEEGLHEADLPGALKNPDQAASSPSDSGTPPPQSGKTSNAPGAAGAAAKPAPSVANKTAPSVANGDIGGANDEQLTQALDVLRGLAVLNQHASG